MKNEDCDEFPLVWKYLVKSEQVHEQIESHYNDYSILFYQFWEPVLQQVSSCEGFESKIRKIEKNPKELFHILSEFREAAFLRSIGFSITFLAEGPDFIAKLCNDLYCCEVKTIEAVTEDEIFRELRQLDLPISISILYDPTAYFDKQMLRKLISKVLKIYQEKRYLLTEKSNRKFTRRVFMGPVSAELDFGGEKNVSGVISPSPKKDYDNTWRSIHDHLSDALKNLSKCKKSGHKIVVLNVRPGVAILLKEVLYGNIHLIPDKGRAYRSGGIFSLPEFSEIQAVVVYSPLENYTRLVFPNSHFHDMDNFSYPQ